VRLASITRHLLGLYHGEPGGKAFRRVLSERAQAAEAGWDAVEAALARVGSGGTAPAAVCGPP
jgi:tRNA-dihydrouridine synthase A